MTFGAMDWVHALWLVVALVAALILLERRGRDVLGRFLASVMQRRLVQRASTTRRYLQIACVGLCGASLVVALMRPQWGLEHVATPRASAELMVCLDVSKSMLAEDVAPSRLERAKAEIEDLLPYLDGDHVGLIAFAGTASVVCPLTPDYGFLRLVLDEVDSGTVRRGGTQLAEPIRKAVAGFGDVSDVSRAIILITDGEDHDSYPVEAAKEAEELGIKIIAIGFGDETVGSEIYYTDPQTGAREVLRHDGSIVRSRLDGETLREIITATDGVYVPAGTAGLLDLESIYRKNIAPLTRGKLDGRGRVIRKEGFQWAVLAGILFLVAAAALTGQRRRRETVVAPGGDNRADSDAVRTAAGALLLLLGAWSVTAVLAPGAAFAQGTPTTAAAPDTATPATTNGVDAPSSEESDSHGDAESTTSLLDIPEDAREAHNAGCLKLSTSAYDDAEELFLAARSSAGTDVEARYSATYNLAWVHVNRADRQREEEPEAALKSLYTAADWFRDAIRLRPDSEAARHNLEIVLGRALALADSLRKQEELTERLDKLIEEQRKLAAATRPLVEQVTRDNEPNVSELLREAFRGHARAQRMLLSIAGELVDDIAAEQGGIEATPEEQRSPEDRIRNVQLQNTLHYMHRARERMGQTRQQFRRKQAERGYRRAAASLTELKRARDQLRDPVAVLTAVIGDLQEQARNTQQLAAADTLQVKADDATTAANTVPSWLTSDYLGENQEGVNGRAAELRARLEAGISHEEEQAADPAAGAPTGANPEDAERERTLAMVKEALPFVQQGETALTTAATSLAAEELPQALQAQIDALKALLEARERFLDLRGLIEASYETERQLQQLLNARHGDEAAGQPPLAIEPLRPGLIEEQQKNIARAARLDVLLAEELAKVEAAATGTATPPGQPPADAQADQEKQRLMMAQQLLERARVAMTGALEHLQDAPPAGQSGEAALVATTTSVTTAVDNLEQLRRLFFSIVEHLQETARRQMELNDTTEEAIHVGDEAARPGRVAPLVPRQEEIGSFTEQIAGALAEQAAQGAQGMPPGGDPAQAQDQAQRLGRAAELVAAAREEMNQAALALQASGEVAPPADADALGEGRTHQDTALQQLAQALALLQPPQEQPQQQDQQQQEEQQQGEDEQKEDEQASSDPAQLLQGIRDREAERRKEKQKPQRYEPVDKDW